MVTTTSAARTISSVHGLGNSWVMSMPTSAMARTADGLTSLPGSDPPDHATARSPARWLNQPSAIWDRPALWTHRNSTTGLPSSAFRSSTTVLLQERSRRLGIVRYDDGVGWEIGIQEPRERDRDGAADELGNDERGNRRGLDPGKRVAERPRDRHGRVREARR